MGALGLWNEACLHPDHAAAASLARAVASECLEQCEQAPVTTGLAERQARAIERLIDLTAICGLRGRSSRFDHPDGYEIEHVQWPPGHTNGITAADFR